MLIGVVDICMPETLNLHTLSNTMNYNIRIEFKDGTVEKFDKKSNIKPINVFKLHDQIANKIYPREWKEIASIPVYS